MGNIIWIIICVILVIFIALSIFSLATGKRRNESLEEKYNNIFAPLMERVREKEFIRDVGLTDTEDGGKKAIYVNFEYRKDGHSVTLSLPLLTIVPIPYMAIREIDIAFKARISAASATSQTDKKSTAMEMGMKSHTSVNMTHTQNRRPFT